MLSVEPSIINNVLIKLAIVFLMYLKLNLIPV
jgi:hypothetical protein